MSGHESLSLPNRFESPHPSLPYPGRLMRLLHPIILILFSAMNDIWHQLSMSDWVAAQFVGHDLPGLTTVTPYQALEEALSRSPIPLSL